MKVARTVLSGGKVGDNIKDLPIATIEGNSNDSCQENSYPLGHYEILGYGVPSY